MKKFIGTLFGFAAFIGILFAIGMLEEVATTWNPIWIIFGIPTVGLIIFLFAKSEEKRHR